MKHRLATLGNEIKRLRKEKGLTQFQLAELAGYDERSIRRIELGERRPKSEDLRNILSVLRLDPLKNGEAWDRIYFIAGYLPPELSITAQKENLNLLDPKTLRRLQLPNNSDSYWYGIAKLGDVNQIDAVSATVFRETEESLTWREDIRKFINIYPDGFYIAKTNFGDQTLVVGYAIYWPIRENMLKLLQTSTLGYGDIFCDWILDSIMEKRSQAVNFYIESVAVLRTAPWFVSVRLVKWLREQLENKLNIKGVWTISITPEGDDLASVMGLKYYKTIMEKQGEVQKLYGLVLKN